MTDSPVAAPNARTMWKREIPPTPAISSRVNASARWLSINQSAFWAGFMDSGLHSKPAHHDRFARASFDSPCSCSLLWKLEPDAIVSSAVRKIAAKASLATSPRSCILRAHSIRRLYPSCPTRDCLSLGQHVREDDDAPPCLEPCQIRGTCGTSGGCGRERRLCAEEIRSRRDRYRDQDRQHHALFGTGVRLCHDRQDRGRLFQEDQHRGRHQRPQDQFRQL